MGQAAVKSPLMEKKHKSRHKSGLNSHAKRRGEVPPPPARSLCCPKDVPQPRGKGGQQEQKWTLGPGYQHAEVHSDPQGSLDALYEDGMLKVLVGAWELY